MKSGILLLLASLLSSAFCAPEAIAYFTGTGITGKATITALDLKGINVTLSVCGFQNQAGYYARIATLGDLLNSATGSTFNPTGLNLDCSSGNPAGDLGSVTADGNGCIETSIIQNDASLYANETSVVLGRSILIQANGTCADYSNTVLARGAIGYLQNSVSAVGGSIPVDAATALFVPTSQGTSLGGSAIFSPITNGTKILIYVRGLTPGSTHGIHIHAFGDLTNVNTTGGHYNPFGKNHSCPGSGIEGHAGDLGNFVADSKGIIAATIDLIGSYLAFGAISSITGRSIVVHNAADDCVTNPAGNSGSRILHGVIGVAGKSVIFPSGIAVLSPKNSTLTGAVTFNYVHDGSAWGLNSKVEISGLTASVERGFQIHEYGDVENLGNTLAVGGASCAFNNVGALEVSSSGKAYTNFFQSTLSFDPNSQNFIMGRGVAIRESAGSCGSGAILGAGVIGYQLNSPTITSNGDLQPSDTNVQAICQVKGTTGNEVVKGTFIFTVNGTSGVNVYITLSGFPASTTRSIHIHAFGDISNGKGDNLGGHYNPTGKNHSCPGSDRHAGDMGNFVTSAKGNIFTLHVNPNASLNYNSKASILGRGIIVHGGTDDCATQPTGNSGPRVAQCVIGLTKSETRSTPVEPTDAPTSAPTATPTEDPNGSSLVSPFLVAVISALFLSFF